jgi:hypothetical protein
MADLQHCIDWSLREDEPIEVDERDVKLNASWALITYSQAKTEDKELFLAKLKAILPEGTEIYGGKELHKDGGFHYHVVMRFPKRVNWKRARHNLMIEDETKAIRISTLRYNQSIRQFVEDTQNYVEKEGDVFGERIDYGMKNSLKRVYEDIHNEEAYDKKKAMLIAADPRRFVYSYPAIRSYLKHESKTRKSVFVQNKIHSHGLYHK